MPRAAAIVTVVAALVGALPQAVVAQFGIYDALARSFSDVSFYMHTGGLAPATPGVQANRLSAYGIEVLLEIGAVSRPDGPPRPPADSVSVVWTQMEVTTGAAGTDTVYRYDVRRNSPAQATVPVWTFELGVGYGQLTGFRSSESDIDLRGAIRELPTVSVYATYEPSGTYLGLRSGFIRFQGLQAWDMSGQSWSGEADSFLAGVALGQSASALGFTLFVEGGYALRPFPSIRWSGAALPSGVPRSMDLHGWTIGGGLQFSLGRS
ncbi:MAG TPA: hypothetical protein VK929_09235 [Longimicrobiales bacterium]|nr:hypothetical protein [Longimicrobiales bacterium]